MPQTIMQVDSKIYCSHAKAQHSAHFHENSFLSFLSTLYSVYACGGKACLKCPILPHKFSLDGLIHRVGRLSTHLRTLWPKARYSLFYGSTKEKLIFLLSTLEIPPRRWIYQWNWYELVPYALCACREGL